MTSIITKASQIIKKQKQNMEPTPITDSPNANSASRQNSENCDTTLFIAVTFETLCD